MPGVLFFRAVLHLPQNKPGEALPEFAAVFQVVPQGLFYFGLLRYIILFLFGFFETGKKYLFVAQAVV